MDRATPAPEKPFDLIGGEAGVRALVDHFYDLMDLDPAFATLRRLHPRSLDGSRDKLFWFLCGLLGGPAHYVERFGHPLSDHRLRAAEPNSSGLGFFFQLRRAKGGGELHLGRRHFNEAGRSKSGSNGLHRLTEQTGPNVAIATAVKGLSVNKPA